MENCFGADFLKQGRCPVLWQLHMNKAKKRSYPYKESIEKVVDAWLRAEGNSSIVFSIVLCP